MKTKIAMAISIAGVLVAGSAAALVNTQVLGGSTAAAPVLADSQQPVQTEPTTVTVAPTVTAATTLPVATTAPAAPVQAAAPVAATQATYAAADAGTVTLDTAGDVLTIVSVTPAAGWTVTKSEPEDSMNVEVKFQSGTIEVEFKANMQFGVVSPSVEVKDSSATSSSVDDNSSGRHGGDDDGGSHGGDDD